MMTKKYINQFSKGIAERAAKIVKCNPAILERKNGLKDLIYSCAKWRIYRTSNVASCLGVPSDLWNAVENPATEKFWKIYLSK